MWTKDEENWLRTNYPILGKKASQEYLCWSESKVRNIAAKLGLRSSYKNSSEVNYKKGNAFRGKKRPEHSKLLIKRGFRPGDYFTESSKKAISENNKIAIREGRKKVDNFRGRHHLESSKKKISLALKNNKTWLKNIRSKERTKKTHNTMMKRYGRLNVVTENAYSSSRRGHYDINGRDYYFRSMWEPNYALYLDFLKKQGEISNWEYEKDTFWFEKIKRGVRSYLPDFKVYNKNGTFEYHEVKGYLDPKSMTKLKRMKKYYPDVKVVLIDAESYKDIKNRMGRLLKFYE